MTVRIGINGFGRIGRSYLRAALRSNADVEVVAINDIADAATLASLLEWDSLAGHLDGVQRRRGRDRLDGARIRVSRRPSPADIAWGDERRRCRHRVDRPVHRLGAAPASTSGAARARSSSPRRPTGDVPAVVLGVNDDTLDRTARTSSRTARAPPTAWRRWRRCCTRRSASSPG